MWVRIPLETYIFILNLSLPPRSEHVNGAVANEIKHVHSPEVIVVLDPRYDLSYKALYISTCSIALRNADYFLSYARFTKIGKLLQTHFWSHGIYNTLIFYRILSLESTKWPNGYLVKRFPCVHARNYKTTEERICMSI